MRELTKSVTGYTWAMSVFWTQQIFNVFGLGGSGSLDRSARAFNNVTQATANEMGDTMRAVFRSGDTLQRGMVDLFLAPFGFVNPGNGGSAASRPRDGAGRNGGSAGGWIDATARAAQAGADVIQGAVDTTARATRRAADVARDQPQQRPSTMPSAPPQLA